MLIASQGKSYHFAAYHNRIRFGVSINEGGRWFVFAFHVFERHEKRKTWSSLYLYLFGKRFVKHWG